MGLINKIGTFAIGTYEENAKNDVEGFGWMLAHYTELFGGVTLAGIGSSYHHISTLGYIGCILTVDGLTRGGNALYKLGTQKVSEFDLNHPTIPQAGLIGTVRQISNYIRGK